MSFEIINPGDLGAPSGWNNGMLGPSGGRVVFVAGQVACDDSGKVSPSGFVEQFAGALSRVIRVVVEAGGGVEDIGRLMIYVSDMEAYRSSLKPLGEAYRELMGRHYPAMALVEVKSLVDPNAVVEIEGTAVLGPADQ